MKNTSCRNPGKSSFSQLLQSCMDREILVIVWVQAWQEKGKGIECCLVKLCTAACVWVAWAKEGNQRVLVLPKAVNSLQHQMGLNSVHEVVRRFQCCSLQEKWNPFNWSQPLGTYDFVFFITLLWASRIFLHQVTCLFYMTRIKAKLTNTQPLGSSLGWLQMQWWYEDGFSSSVIPSWHFISMAHIYAWIQAVFHWAFIPRSEFKEMKPSIIIILFIKAKACNGT